MTLLEEAAAHMEKMREHTDCCGMPIFRRMAAELGRLARSSDTAQHSRKSPPMTTKTAALAADTGAAGAFDEPGRG